MSPTTSRGGAGKTFAVSGASILGGVYDAYTVVVAIQDFFSGKPSFDLGQE